MTHGGKPMTLRECMEAEEAAKALAAPLPLGDEQIKAMWHDNFDGFVSLEEATVIIRETEKAHGIKEAK